MDAPTSPRKSLTSSPQVKRVSRKSVVARTSTQPNSSYKVVRKLIYESANEHVYRDKTIPRIVIVLNTFLNPMIGILIAARCAYDGRVSLVGILLRIVYFSAFLLVIYFDTRFESAEKYSRMLPKAFGIIMIGVQLVGVLRTYDCELESPWTCV